MRKSWMILAAMSLGVCLIATVARSQEKAAGAKPTPEQMMAEMAKYSDPSAEHDLLKPMAGKFNAEVTMQMTPDMPVEKSTGTMNGELILGGRFLKGEYTGTMMGKPFKGVQVTGYDRMKKKYVTTWMDDMSTMVMMAEGEGDASAKTITTHADCPMGPGMKVKSVITVVDDDHHTYESYMIEGGKETKTMTIKYTRAK